MLIVLTYGVSLTIQPSFKLSIYNQCLNVDLVSPVYITDRRSECYMAPNQKVYAGNMMRSSFIIKSGYESYGALIYRLKRKQSHKSIKIGKDTSIVAQLLVIWRISERKELYADVLLIEHDKELDLDKKHLKELRYKNISQLRMYPAPAIETWLSNDNTALKTTPDIMNGGQLLNITISQIERYNYVRMPAHIDPERWVILEMVIVVIIIMCTVSLALRLPPCVNIFNLCLNVKLVSPVYFGNGVICSKLSGRKIDIGAKMSASFEINATQDDFECALLFKLQRYSDRQYNMDVSTTEADKNETERVHMLVAWKAKNAKLFVQVALVECIKEFTWNEEKLKELYYENHNRLKEYNDTISDTWLIGANMVLKTTFGASNLKGGSELSISISEEKEDKYAMKPFCIHLER
jgi:hypothetical protein